MQRRVLSAFAGGLLSAALFVFGCGGGSTPIFEPDAGGTPDGAGELPEAGNGEIGGETGPGDTPVPPSDVPLPETADCTPNPLAPAGHATITFCIDDSANRTYADGDMRWTGSFQVDPETGIITYTDAWLPTDGPFPVLYDDGPVPTGHEMRGAVAGDHIFCTEVYFEAEADTPFAYGLLNELDDWIWVGPDGRFTIPAGSTCTFEAAGLTFPAFGAADLKLTFDTARVAEAFTDYVDPELYQLYVKTSGNAWANVQLVDDGRRGDATAGDGIYTYQHSERLGAHDGGLYDGQHVQFMYVFATEGQDPKLGIEYKTVTEGGERGLADGVGAQVDPDGPAGPAGWNDATVIHELDSKGVTLNPTVVISGGSAPGCQDDSECTAEGKVCVAGRCVECRDDANCAPERPACVDAVCVQCRDDAQCADDERCDASQCVPDDVPGCTDDADCAVTNQVCVAGNCVDCRSDAECAALGQFCVAAVCVVCRTDADCADIERCASGRCVPRETATTPLVYLVDPRTGPSAGGTAVDIVGDRFVSGATVRFGANAATDVQVVSATQIACTTPAGPIGPVDVVVVNPDGERGEYLGGFAYYDAGQAPVVTQVDPAQGPVSGGTVVTILGNNFVPGSGLTVSFGQTLAENVEYLQPTSLRATTPSGTLGPVNVTVTNPNGLHHTLTGGFTYVPNLVDWGQINAPLTVTAVAGSPTEALYAEIWEPGVTEAAGAGAGVTAQIGYGPVGSDPLAADSAWVWSTAQFHGDGGYENHDDVYTGTLTVAAAGNYSFTFRFSMDGSSWMAVDGDGTGNGTSPDLLGSVEVVAPPTGPLITAVVPASGPIEGGTEVAIRGLNLADVTGVRFAAAPATVVSAGPSELRVTSPAHAEGWVDVRVENGAGEFDVLERAFYYGTLSIPIIDGVIGADWSAGSRIAENTVASNWTAETPPPFNELHSLYVAADGDNLYVAIAGQVEFNNAIVLYVDLDYGSGQGMDDMRQCSDNVGGVDTCLCGSEAEAGATPLHVADTQFGAEVGFAVRGASGFSGAGYPSCTALGDSDMAGWRRLDAVDMPWLCSQVVATADDAQGQGVVETRIPLAELFGGPPPTEARTLAFFARVVNPFGTATANQCLPEDVPPGADPGRVGAVVTYTLQ